MSSLQLLAATSSRSSSSGMFIPSPLAAGLTGILAFFFYRSLLAAVPLSAAGVYAFGQMGRKKAEQAREELSAQFRECILAVATSPAAVQSSSRFGPHCS